MPEKGYSISGLANALHKDRATVAKICAALTPVSVDAKARRYRLADVEMAIAAKPGKSLRDEKLGEEIRKLRIRNDKDEGKLIARAEVVGAISRCLSSVDQSIEAKLVNEWPSAVAGMDVPSARIFGRRLGDDLRKCFSNLAGEFPK